MIKHINLTNEKAENIHMSKQFNKRWLGGRGYNSRLLYCFKDEIPEEWSDDTNVVAISAGKFAGTSFPSSGRTTISVLKSPVSGMFSDGNLGGHFGPALKLAGIDTLLLTGKLKEISYIYIDRSGIASLIELPGHAKHWGCASTNMFIRHKSKGYVDLKVLAVGQGSFNGCFTGVVNCDNRVAGGGGSGAVLASKNIKAIAVEYDITETSKPKFPELFEAVSKSAEDHIKKHPVFDTFKRYGTTSLVEIHSALKYFPTHNFLFRTFRHWKKLSGQAYLEKKLKEDPNHLTEQDNLAKQGRLGCRNCPIVCSNQEKIEYETLNCLGNKIGLDDLDQIEHLNNVYFNDAGLDVIETTSIISALMEMSFKGLIDVRIDFGDYEFIEMFLSEFLGEPSNDLTFGACFKQGFKSGLELAEKHDFIDINWWKFADFDEIEAEVYVSSKGKAYSGVYPNEANKGVALATATSTRGADHLRSLPTLATYASWYMAKGGWKKLIKLMTIPLRSARIMKSDAKFLVGDLWETYENVFGVPKYYVNLWRSKGFLLDNRINDGWGGMIKFTQSLYAISDSLSTCRFTSPWRFGVGSKFWIPALRYLGVEVLERELFQVGHHINLLEKDLLYYYGKPVKDTVPSRFFEGKGGLSKETWDEIYADYCKECNLDSEGKPDDYYMDMMLRGDFTDQTQLNYFTNINKRR
jgi:aldehyde:ferredoxin oxidoreductase